MSQENELITSAYVNSLLQLIEQQLESEVEPTPAIAAARRHFENTRLRIATQKEQQPESRWTEIA